MSSSSKSNRKGSKTRNPKKSSNHVAQSPTYEGVYGNPQLVHYFLNLMGTKCVVQVRNGAKYSGIFHTVSPDMQIVLASAHRLESNATSGNQLSECEIPLAEQLIDELIFKIQDVVQMNVLDVNLGYAEVSVKSNGDAGTEAKFQSANGSEFRALEPWDGGGDSTADVTLGGLEDGSSGNTFNGTNGWEAEDMFRTNREQYGVKSSYNPDLPEYTTPLADDHSENFEIRKARASRLAHEIESSQSYMKNISAELDDNTTEEEKFSSVSRDFPKFGRGRARPRDPVREQRSQRPPGHYQGSGNMPRSSGYGPGGRSNPPPGPTEPPTSSPSQTKPYPRQSGSMPPVLPPRLMKNQQRGENFPREDERGNRGHSERMQDPVPHHQGYPSQPKASRQSSQGRMGYNKGSLDYSQPQPLVDPTMPGQTTPRSLSRDSSNSSLPQQSASQWKPDERGHEAIPPNTNQPMGRNFPSRGDRCRNQHLQRIHVIPRILNRPSRLANRSMDEMRYPPAPQQATGPGPAMQGHPMQPGTGHFQDKTIKHSQQHGYRQVNPQAAQEKKFYFSPPGHSPPVPGNPSAQMMIQPPTQPHHPAMPPRQSRFPTVTTAMPATAPQTTGPHARRSTGVITDVPGKPPVVKKTMSSSSGQGGQTMALSKSSSTGSANDIKNLQDFQKNFNLQLSDNNSDISGDSKSVSSSGGSRSKSMDDTSSSRGGAAPKPQRPVTVSQTPAVSESSQKPPSQSMKPAVSAFNATQTENVETTPPTSVGLTQQQQTSSGLQTRHQVPMHSPNVWPTSEQGLSTAPPPPAVNVPSPRPAAPANDVQTVSASAQYISSTIDPASQQAPAQKPIPAETPAQTAPLIEHQKTPSASSGEAVATDSGAKGGGLNPNAEAFTPRSFSFKTGGSNTPRSPTPVAPPPNAAYFNPGHQIVTPSVYVLPHKPPMPKQGQTILSPSPSEPQMVGVNAHMHPTTVGHHILQHGYHPTAAGPLVITPNHGTPTIVQQASYSGVEPTMMYNPHSGHHIMQPATRTIPAGYATAATPDYSYQQALHIQQQQQQHPSPQHHGQQQAVAHQQPAQAGGYIAQQPQQQAQPQQQRPHSAHTPNAAQIPPASPAAANVQQQMAVTTMSVNAVQMHAAASAQNPVITPTPPHGYFQPPILAHQMHVPNSHHGSYGMAQRFMVFPGNPAGQHGSYVQQPAVVSSANHGQQQYAGSRQYHTQATAVVPGYQPPGPN